MILFACPELRPATARLREFVSVRFTTAASRAHELIEAKDERSLMRSGRGGGPNKVRDFGRNRAFGARGGRSPRPR